jgi:hypothetical protein
MLWSFTFAETQVTDRAWAAAPMIRPEHPLYPWRPTGDDPTVQRLRPPGLRRRVPDRVRARFEAERVAHCSTVGVIIDINVCHDDRVRCGQRHLISAASHLDALAAQSE